MNAVTETKAATREPSAMYRALFSLARTQKRLAHEAKRLAMQAESEGRRAVYTAWRAEADRLWHDAKWHLGKARSWK